MVTYLSTFGQDISMPCIHHILRLVPNSPVEEAPLPSVCSKLLFLYLLNSHPKIKGHHGRIIISMQVALIPPLLDLTLHRSPLDLALRRSSLDLDFASVHSKTWASSLLLLHLGSGAGPGK